LWIHLIKKTESNPTTQTSNLDLPTATQATLENERQALDRLKAMDTAKGQTSPIGVIKIVGLCIWEIAIKYREQKDRKPYSNLDVILDNERTNEEEAVSDTLMMIRETLRQSLL
jgi:hypothetical protein